MKQIGHRVPASSCSSSSSPSSIVPTSTTTQTIRNGIPNLTTDRMDGCSKSGECKTATASAVNGRAPFVAATGTTLAKIERIRLLQAYFPQDVVDAYCGRCSSSCTTNTKCSPEEQQDQHDYGNADAVPNDALIEALQKNPVLVMKETPIQRYIDQLSSNLGVSEGTTRSAMGTGCTSGSTQSDRDPGVIRDAALKLANYWKARKGLFKERAYLPMRLNPTIVATEDKFLSALSPYDMDLVHSGVIVPLPSSTDPKGRQVFVIDRSKLKPHHWTPSPELIEQSFARLAFYWLHIASTNPVSQSKGIVVLSVQTSKVPKTCNQTKLLALKIGYLLSRDAFPIQDFEFHLAFLPSNISLLAPFVFSIKKILASLMGMSGIANVHIHAGFSDEAVVHHLIDTGGFNRADFPLWLGGTNWDMNSFRMWLSKQMKVEQRLWENGEEKRQLRNIKEAERSKLKRQRMKMRFENLQRQAQELESNNRSTESENKNLEKLLLHAQLAVDVLETINHKKRKGRH